MRLRRSKLLKDYRTRGLVMVSGVILRSVTESKGGRIRLVTISMSTTLSSIQKKATNKFRRGIASCQFRIDSDILDYENQKLTYALQNTLFNVPGL